MKRLLAITLGLLMAATPALASSGNVPNNLDKHGVCIMVFPPPPWCNGKPTPPEEPPNWIYWAQELFFN